MASLGHIAVGLTAARIHRSAERPGWPGMAWWSALSMLPDVDVIGFPLGVRYGDPWGHRGATHSLAFAVAVAGVIGLAARALRLPPRRTWAIATVVLVSHGLLDTLTDGGLGCALLWPLDLTRYFAPWRPIPVAPIGLSFLSPSGLFVAATELVLFAPLFVYGLRPRRKRIGVVAVWAAALWLIASRDPVRESALGLLLREQTEYAPAFSESAFRTIKIGQSENDVRQRLGRPIGEYWDYFSADEAADPSRDPGCPFVYLESDAVVVLPRDLGPATRLCSDRGIAAGMSHANVRQILGVPRDLCLRYSRGAPRRYHRARLVCFSQGKVVALISEWQPGG